MDPDILQPKNMFSGTHLSCNYAGQIGSFPQVEVNIKYLLKPPPRSHLGYSFRSFKKKQVPPLFWGAGRRNAVQHRVIDKILHEVKLKVRCILLWQHDPTYGNAPRHWGPWVWVGYFLIFGMLFFARNGRQLGISCAKNHFCQHVQGKFPEKKMGQKSQPDRYIKFDFGSWITYPKKVTELPGT